MAEENGRDEAKLGGSECGDRIKDGVEKEVAGHNKREVNEQAKENNSEDSSKEKKDSGPRYARLCWTGKLSFWSSASSTCVTVCTVSVETPNPY